MNKELLQPAAKVTGKWIDYCDNIRTCIDVDLPMLTNLYTSQPQREWVGLTDDEMKAIDPDGFAEGFPQKIIAALKAKNT